MAGESAREVARRAREKAERLQRRAELFDKGAAGEDATAQILSTLPPSWTAMHDVKWPGRRFANIDHIVVGPAGVFVVDSKNWSGRVTVNDGHLSQNGRSREKTVAGCADAALAVSELAGSSAAGVFPVLCFVGDDDLTGWCRDVMVCSSSNLAPMLLSRPVILTAEQVRDVSVMLDASLRAATLQPAPLPSPTRQRQIPPAAKRSKAGRIPRRRQRKRSALARPIVGLLLIVGMLLYGPQISSAFGGWFVGNLSKPVAPEPTCAGDDAQNGVAAGAGDDSSRRERPKSAKRVEERKRNGNAQHSRAAKVC